MADTIPSQFRLSQDTLDTLDRIAAQLSAEQGRNASRTDAVRWAAVQCDPEKKKKNNPKKSAKTY